MMSFQDAVRITLTTKYAVFSGRASRSEYWWFMLFFWLVTLAYFAVVFLTGSFERLLDAIAFSNFNQLNGLDLAIIGLYALFILATLIPGIAVAVRRFRDRNISGWWFIAILIASYVPSDIVAIIATIIQLFIVIPKGTDGPNRFGPDPLATQNHAEVFS